MQQPSNIDLKSPELYTNRLISLLEFNRRVLEQAKDPEVPLLERLKFLCILSTNMDEFFEIRLSGIKQKAELGSVQTDIDGRSPQEVLRSTGTLAHEIVHEQYQVLNEQVIPALAENSIHFVRRNHWSQAQRDWLRCYFEEQLLPVLSPLGLDPAHPFPKVLNKSLNFILSLEGKDAFGRNSGFAIVQAPRSLPRVIQLPEEEIAGGGPHDFVFLSSVIHAFVNDLFPGMTVRDCYQFRVTRNSDLFIDEEEVDDLMRALEGELPQRRYGQAVRLEVAANCPDDMADLLLNEFELSRDDLYQVDGPVNLNRLMAVYDLVERTDLKYPSFTPALPTALSSGADIFKAIHKRDILLHHPFQSFLPVIELVRQAAEDQNVLAIKQTLYRTGPDSAIVENLVKAAQAGKEVTVVIELLARFDERENIVLANRLQEAGAHVVYGVVGYKTHCKMLLVVRREGAKLRNYVHLGTGNYHSRTARLYTDYGLLTAEKSVAEDVHRIFLQLTSLGRFKDLHRLLQAPFTLHEQVITRINREAELAEAGKTGRVIAKVNALTEPRTIQALYRASQAGAEIDLIVRGICVLRPGIEGVSDNIRVRSIVGRFLEHTRVFYFGNDGNPDIFCSSADWMDRNFFRRVESAFPVIDPQTRQRIVDDLNCYLRDNRQAWLLGSDGTYTRSQPDLEEEPFNAQQVLLETLSEDS
ncbi:polyphosphate kinase 1 [Halorhodospira halochloris]|uniref:Polyphosphate kinase n=1 Tax=Halorhodospira halochloris TaxID=1052 RepID=A0A0X8X875_HALHR|nr:polyphosphate kinase 1 [Halorhodospira halochloris]MBK1651122.1 polyphosphate kinase 1 [Halorhodospira halochloris]MCG5531138.1 polyphosphate kinase 1 [Halorhodospira halochloris]BAU57390.1 polyphosphate kinase [Halorhodospira halochloris]